MSYGCNQCKNCEHFKKTVFDRFSQSWGGCELAWPAETPFSCSSFKPREAAQAAKEATDGIQKP